MSIKFERVKEIIREEAAEQILYKLSDPRVGFCTITRVDLAKDYSYARIFVSILGSEAEKRSGFRALRHARGLIQTAIAARLRTRTTPEVDIRLDESIERSFRIIEKIKEARASDSDHGASSLTPTEPASAGGEEEKEEQEEKEDASS